MANPFINPVGSVDTPLYGNYGANPRHSVNLSSNNPYLPQIEAWQNEGGKNQDLDALYEMALKWEADQAALIQKEDLDWAKLQEQRSYDDPVAEIDRQRRAGLNPDLQGASSGASTGSSASMDKTPLLEQENTTPFSNMYGNVQAVTSGINSALSAISTLTNMGTAVGNLLSTFRTLPHQNNLLDEQAKLANVQAQELPKQVQIQKAAQATQDKAVEADVAQKGELTANAKATRKALELSTFGNSIAHLSSLASVLTPDLSDNDKKSLLKYLGVSDDEQDSIISAINALRKNPQFKAQYFGDTFESSQNEAKAGVYTVEACTQIYQSQIDAEIADNNLKVASSRFQKSYLSILEDLGFARNKAEADNASVLFSIDQTKFNTESLQFARTRLQREVEVFGRQLNFCKEQVNLAKEKIRDIKQNAYKNQRGLTFEEEAIIQNLNNRIANFEMLGISHLGEAYKFAQGIAASIYMSHHFVDDKGNLSGVLGSSNEFTFANFSFDQLLSGDVSDEQFAVGMTDTLLDFLSSIYGSTLSALSNSKK